MLKLYSTIIPVLKLSDICDDYGEDFATELREFSYGASGQLESGYSYLVRIESLKSWWSDTELDMLKGKPYCVDSHGALGEVLAALPSTGTGFVLFYVPGEEFELVDESRPS